jgi:chromate transporter
MNRNPEIISLIKLFLRLGFTAFGGPAAHIAMMQEEVVNKRKWFSQAEFLDLIGATNLIPGPNSTEMAMHIGQEKAGWKGLIVAGLCFIMPAVCITLFFAWLYKNYGQLPQIQVFIYGIKPAIIAVILAAIYPLAQKAYKSNLLVIIGIITLILSLLGFQEIYLLFGAGFFAVISENLFSPFSDKKRGIFLLMPLSHLSFISATNLHLFSIFLKIGAILYGSGYVLFAFLDTELVQTGLLSRQQLIDAIAVGQFTPGPVFSAVTFVGYQINDFSGAAIATFAIFLPSFLFVALLNPLVKKMRDNPSLSSFLDAVNIASVAIICSVCFSMAQVSLIDWRSCLIAIISLFFTFGFRKINSAFIVFGGALLGYLLTLC